MRTLLLLAVAVLLLGCSLQGPPVPQDIPAIEYGTNDVGGVVRWVHANIGAVSDRDQYGVREYWATPEETWIRRSGDCEDFAILTLYLIDRDLGIDGEMIEGARWGNPAHAWIRAGGADYDPTLGHRVDYHGTYLEYGVLSWITIRARLGI